MTQFLFEFVSNEEVDEKRKEIQSLLQKRIERATFNYSSPGYLHMDVREMSGIINEHVLITKDKYGEVYLNLRTITEVIEKNNKNILSDSYDKTEKIFAAVIARAFKTLILINQLHEDYLIDFEDGLKQLGKLISENSYVTKQAIYNRLDLNWLIHVYIPKNIEEIHKEIRSKGFLR